MWQALGQLLPIAIAAALSTLPIMATILILLSDRRDEAAIPYVAGWVLGAAVVLTVATLAAQFLPDERSRHHQVVVGAFTIVIGAALIVFGVVAVRHRRSAGAHIPMPGWMDRIGSLQARPAFGLGLALNLRPKALLLVAAAGIVLRSASLQVDGTAFAMAVFIVVATSTVVTPVLLTLLSPERMGPRLGRARQWLGSEGVVITAVITLLIGVVIVCAGLVKI